MGATGCIYPLLVCIFLYGAEVNGYVPENNYVSMEEFLSFKVVIHQSIRQFTEVVQNQQNQIDTLERKQKKMIQQFEEEILTLKYQHANEIKRLENDIAHSQFAVSQSKSTDTRRTTTERNLTAHHHAPRSVKPQHTGGVLSEQNNVTKSSLPSSGDENKSLIPDTTIKNQDKKFTEHIRNIGDNNTKVAFFARSDDLQDLNKDQIIPFRHVHTNVGNLYNVYTSVFSCGVPGTYVFSCTITSKVGRRVYAYLSKNREVVLQFPSPSLSGDYGSASGTAILELKRGDAVMVKSSAVFDGAVLNAGSYFSGFLLYPTY